jgi:hypothetical protein
VAGEQASGVTDRFGGQREGRSSPEGFFVVEGIGGREETAASQSRGHRRGLSGRGGCTRRRGAWGGIKTVRGWLEQAVRGGSIQSERNGGGGAEEQPRARGKEVVGSSRRRCRARGGDEEFGGGPEWRFTVAQQRQHDGAVAATGGGGKGQLTGRGAPFKGRTRRWPRAAEMVAGTAGGRGR